MFDMFSLKFKVSRIHLLNRITEELKNIQTLAKSQMTGSEEVG